MAATSQPELRGNAGEAEHVVATGQLQWKAVRLPDCCCTMLGTGQQAQLLRCRVLLPHNFASTPLLPVAVSPTCRLVWVQVAIAAVAVVNGPWVACIAAARSAGQVKVKLAAQNLNSRRGQTWPSQVRREPWVRCRDSLTLATVVRGPACEPLAGLLLSRRAARRAQQQHRRHEQQQQRRAGAMVQHLGRRCGLGQER